MTLKKSIGEGFGRGELYDILAQLTGEIPYSATITIGAEADDKRDVTVQLKDYSNTNLAKVSTVIGYLTNISGTLTVSDTATGEVEALVAGSVYRLITDNTGEIVIQFGAAAAASCYLNVALPNGTVIRSAQIVFAA